MSDIEEVAKAAGEVSKFGTKALSTTEKISGFLAKVFKVPIEEAVGMIGDRLRFLRWQRQVRIVEEANQILDRRGIRDNKAILPKLALPIFENATLEEDNELQDIWIRLITNAMDPNFSMELRFAFIEIIKSLNPLDAKILDYFYTILSKEQKLDLKEITGHYLTKEQICQALSISLQDYFVSIYNLFRVQCLAPAILKGGIKMGSESLTIFKGTDAITMTPLGKNLVEACIKKN